MKKRILSISLAITILLSFVITANASEMVTLFAYNGRTKQVEAHRVAEERAVGWYEGIVVYAADGRSKLVSPFMVEAERKVGWYVDKKDVTVNMFALDGRCKPVFKANVRAEQAVGWYTLDEYMNKLIQKFGFETAINELEDIGIRYDNFTLDEYREQYKKIIKQYYADKGYPLAVVNWDIGENSIGIPEITIFFRNISQKTIVSFEQKFTCYDAYGKPTTDFPSLHNGDFVGYCTNEKIESGDFFSMTWTLYSNEKTYKISWPVIKKIAFSDGTTWYR